MFAARIVNPGATLEPHERLPWVREEYGTVRPGTPNVPQVLRSQRDRTEDKRTLQGIQATTKAAEQVKTFGDAQIEPLPKLGGRHGCAGRAPLSFCGPS